MRGWGIPNVFIPCPTPKARRPEPPRTNKKLQSFTSKQTWEGKDLNGIYKFFREALAETEKLRKIQPENRTTSRKSVNEGSSKSRQTLIPRKYMKRPKKAEVFHRTRNRGGIYFQIWNPWALKGRIQNPHIWLNPIQRNPIKQIEIQRRKTTETNWTNGTKG